MGEIVTLEGQDYTKRNPLGVLGLSIITLGIYWLYWYYQVNIEIRRFQKDETVRPGVALLAMVLGWVLIIPPFISMYNTSLHVAHMEEQKGIPSRLSPALNIVLLLVFAFGTGIYTQEHLNRVWETVTSADPAAPS
jgi:Domain of unknown function (DUF4234)